MAAIPKKSKSRRQKMRQRRAEAGSAFLRLGRRLGIWPLVAGLLFFAGATAIALYGEQTPHYSVGERIDQPIIARVTFTQTDVNQTKKNKEAARANTPSYYRLDRKLIDRICGELINIYQTALAKATFEEFKQEAVEAGWPVSEEAYNLLHADDSGGVAEAFKTAVERLREDLAREYTAREASKDDREPAAKTSYVVFTDDPGGDGAETAGAETFKVEIVDIVYTTNKRSIAGRAATMARVFPLALQDMVAAFLTNVLQKAPILVYDQARTLEEMRRAEEAVPPVVITYEKDNPFIFPGELTAADLELLRQHQKTFQGFLATDTPEARKLRKEQYLAWGGTAGVFALLTLVLFGYAGLYQPRIVQVRTRILGFAALLLGMLLATRGMSGTPALGALTPVPILLATSIIALAYKRRFAVGCMAIATLLAALTIQRDITAFATLMAGVIVIGFLLEDVRTRTQILTAGFAAGFVMFVTGFAFALVNRQELIFSLTEAAWAALSALLAALLVQALLPYVERTFKIATSLTLLEWRDANKPLLQLLVREAPGTYNHSLVLGAMAQSAAEAVGADGLLAQVGALYHDIGKIHQSEYYSENQEAAINLHDKLEPRMSLLVILSHVKNGLALASEYGLPKVLHPFIAEHHGTTVVRYFHHAASERQPKIASGRHDREVSEAEFRYEGPKPQSKETAILMLCDGVEGAVRAMHEPTAGRIESAVHAVLMDRLQDGQFDDCDITLKELYRVEESLVKSLVRFYHGRVAYPKAGSKETPSPDAEQAPAAGGAPSPAAAG